MSKLGDILTGTKILEEADSPINGKLIVIHDLAWGTYIKGGGLSQSGGVVNKVWYTSLKKVKEIKPYTRDCLVLGLGAGGVIEVIDHYWPESTITGVEIDPVMINLGEKYMGLDRKRVGVVETDANIFVDENLKHGKQYSLILIDMYVQDNVPEEFTKPSFYKKIKDLLTKDGIAVFNRLYYEEKKKESEIAHQELKNTFSNINTVYPEANVMFICQAQELKKSSL